MAFRPTTPLDLTRRPPAGVGRFRILLRDVNISRTGLPMSSDLFDYKCLKICSIPQPSTSVLDQRFTICLRPQPAKTERYELYHSQKKLTKTMGPRGKMMESNRHFGTSCFALFPPVAPSIRYTEVALDQKQSCVDIIINGSN